MEIWTHVMRFFTDLQTYLDTILEQERSALLSIVAFVLAFIVYLSVAGWKKAIFVVIASVLIIVYVLYMKGA